MKKKMPVIMISGVMTALLALSMAGCSSGSAPTASPEIASIPSPEQTHTPAPTPTPDEPDMMAGIQGSNIKDIQLGVANYGMEDSSAQGAPDGAPYRWTASKSWEFPDSTILLDYSLVADDDQQLISGSFGATWDGITSSDVFDTIASNYISFIATVPYDASDAQTAKQWVLDQIDTVAGNDPVSTTIGDATFTLSGTASAGSDTASSYLLQIQKAEDGGSATD